MGQDNRPHLQNKRIKVYTRSFSPELYKLSGTLFPQNIENVRLTDQTADGYFFTMLKDTSCDIAINVDEDAFIVDLEAVFDLAEYVVANNYANAGIPDCGPACPRGMNPIITNPFFNILNLELIRDKYSDIKAIKKFDYEKVKDEMVSAFPNDILEKISGDFECIDYEPYYPFFFWLAYNFKTLYLLGEKHEDKFSTILHDLKGNPLCFHSWFARKYKIQKFHTDRINNLINEAYSIRSIERPHFKSSDYWKFRGELIIREFRKIISRAFGWPRKWKKKYKRWKRNKNNR